MMKQKLNLACGKKYLKDYVNLDIDAKYKPDVVWNLDKFPYPFEDNSFNEILASHILEHVDKPDKTMKELYRILKPNGKLIILFPYHKHPNAWFGFEHKRAIIKETFEYFYYKNPRAYSPDLPKFRGYSYKFHPTYLGYIVYPFIKWLRHFCDILILQVTVVLTK